MQIFKDRTDAGRRLSASLSKYRGREDAIVLGLPRGGVPVAFEVAAALDIPLDVFLVRKLGFPGHKELAIGAIASGGARVVNREIVDLYKIPENAIESIAESEKQELERRERVYRGERSMPDLRGKVVILVDDGLATGSTMRAAVSAVKAYKPKRIVVAVPTAPVDTCEELKREVDEAVCLTTPEPFYAVGLWYEDFSQTTDEEVISLLGGAAMGRAA